VDATELAPGAHIALRGRLDASTLPDVRDTLRRALAAGSGDLVVDLAEVDLRDAAGLGMLLSVHRQARQQGRRLVLTAVPPGVGRLLRMTRLHLVLAEEARTPAAV
jgi:anti-anti-sigma factor